MTNAAELGSDAPYVETVINYQDLSEFDGTPLVLDQVDVEKTTLRAEPHRVRIFNARRAARRCGLDRSAFELVPHRTAVTDFHDRRQIRDVYEPEIRALVQTLTGARDVLIFGDVLRSESAEIRERSQMVPPGEQWDRSRQAISRFAHVDWNRESVADFAGDIVGAKEAKKLLRRRYQLINLWRGVETVFRNPLAVCDGSTVAESDLVPWETRYPPGPVYVRSRYGWQLKFNAMHRWYYYPSMTPDELLVFKLIDSDPTRIQYAAHTAFEDPTTPRDAGPRVSFEIRAICFFD